MNQRDWKTLATRFYISNKWTHTYKYIRTYVLQRKKYAHNKPHAASKYLYSFLVTYPTQHLAVDINLLGKVFLQTDVFEYLDHTFTNTHRGILQVGINARLCVCTYCMYTHKYNDVSGTRQGLNTIMKRYKHMHQLQLCMHPHITIHTTLCEWEKAYQHSDNQHIVVL